MSLGVDSTGSDNGANEIGNSANNNRTNSTNRGGNSDNDRSSSKDPTDPWSDPPRNVRGLDDPMRTMGVDLREIDRAMDAYEAERLAAQQRLEYDARRALGKFNNYDFGLHNLFSSWDAQFGNVGMRLDTSLDTPDPSAYAAEHPTNWSDVRRSIAAGETSVTPDVPPAADGYTLSEEMFNEIMGYSTYDPFDSNFRVGPDECVEVPRGIPERFKEVIIKGGIDIKANIIEAENMSFLEWEKAVKTNGKWDYKNTLNGLDIDDKLLDDFGNYHFGIVAAAWGFNLEGSIYGAGANQVLRQGGGNPDDLAIATALLSLTYGGYTLYDSITRSMTNSGFTWGDNTGDAKNIMNGWDYYDSQ